MNRLLSFSLLFSILFLLSSCQTTNKYGSRHSRYSSGRIAHFDAPKHEKKRGNRSYTAKNKKKYRSFETDKSAPSVVEASPSSNKVRYHSERNSILRDAQKYQGIPYVYGGKSPKKGFDCSGFVTYVFNSNDIYINGTAESLSRMGKRKNINDLNPGDLVFFGEKGSVNHVGIVSMNNGKDITMIHSSSSAGIKSDNITQSDYWSARMLYGADIVTPHFEEDLGMK